MGQNPGRHIDVGSRIDGFVAHLACVRTIEVFDIRPLSVNIQNVTFRQWDITQSAKEFHGVSDCVSCLHTLEHIGLGRYADKVDPDGWKLGFKNLSMLLSYGGHLWLSVPIGREHVGFNAHRVFDPATIRDYGIVLGLALEEFTYYDGSDLNTSVSIDDDMKRMAIVDYGLGIFLFRKENGLVTDA
ncbi:DUF268 domain-containing protein [Pseudomonadales bacterium]|nr:DUF268 domain-containing protein [Pseudomonadales bacterium]